MIVWSGWGWLVPVAVFLFSLVLEATSEAAAGSDQYYQQQPWLFALTTVLAGALVWFVDRRLERKPAKVLIEKETGREVVLRTGHTFFFVPMRHWAWIAPALGCAFVLYRALASG